MSLGAEIIFVVLSYLIGAIPFGYLLVKYFAGENVLEKGSGNIGSTNVRRIAGKKLSVITQLMDMLKGLLPVAIFLFFIDENLNTSEYFVYLVALASIVGHDFSVYLGFKGGKGVNTTLGASLLIAPYPVFISVAVYFLVKWKFKYVSLGSVFLSISLPLSEFGLYGTTNTFYYLLLCMVLIIFTHRANIRRLLQKQEFSS